MKISKNFGQTPSTVTFGADPVDAERAKSLDFGEGAHWKTGRYRDLGEIGRGGMGSVHQVLDRSLLRQAAVKMLSPQLGVRKGRVQRFCKEAQITGQLDHPNIAPIYDLDRDDLGNQYFCMKLVEGVTLEDVVTNLGEERLHPERLAELLQILVKVCEALAFAHSRGVIHRDIKPSNIMVGDFGQVYLMDWGIAHLLPEATPGVDPERRVRISDELAKLTEPLGTIVGTPRFMSPEQVHGRHDEVCPQTDVFALGGTLYFILTGHPPYTEKSYVKLLLQAQDARFVDPEDAVPGGVQKHLADIVRKAMMPEIEDRFTTVREVQREIEGFLRGAWSLPTKVYAPGSKIVTQGDEADSAYIIVEGTCLAVGESGNERVILREMGAGEVFGETAIFSSSAVRTASVEAVDEVKVMIVTGEILTSGLGLSSWMGRFVQALSDRFADVDQRLRDMERSQREGLDATR